MPRPLKVFRTPIGFHDAYVATTSRKAALEAWGADTDLFASGSAELVTDPSLTAAALASPGQVIKLSRGSLGEHLRAAGRAASQTRPARAAATANKAHAHAPPPRPSRAALSEAEAAVREFEIRAAAERAALDQREAELLNERKRLNARHRREADSLDARVERAREKYDTAMACWRAE